MIITRDNYEPFFLDYLEGNLEENMINEFLDFLEQHPDLKEELHLFETIDLPEEQVVFQGKEHLYKPVTEEKSVFEIKAIALMEGDLKAEERKSFEAYLASHPELNREYDLFLQTRLVADKGIKYPGKQNLYRKPGRVILLNWLARAAAVVFILWGIHSLFQTGSQTVLPTSNQEIASVKPQSVLPKEMEASASSSKTEKGEMLVDKAAPNPGDNHQQTRDVFHPLPSENNISAQRDLTVMEEIHPLLAQLESEAVEPQLAVARTAKVEKINDTRNIMTIDEFLAARVKKAGKGGWLSANRILQTGLNVASELSGDRIGYKVKNGKVSSLDFESGLMAFSIPLQKN